MLNASDLIREGALRADAIEQCRATAPELAAALGAAASMPPIQLAALALVAGRLGLSPALPLLQGLLTRGDAAGKAAAWAIARMEPPAAMSALTGVLGGSLDARENAYFGLAVLAARGGAPGLAEAMAAQVDAELARSKAKQTGLGEQACRILAILGAPQSLECINRVSDGDPYSDRFELQRLRKAMTDGRRDGESLEDLGQPWSTIFADLVYAPPVAKPVAEAPPVAKPAAAPEAPRANRPPSAPTKAAETGTEDPDGDAGQDEVVHAVPIEWKTFATSPEAMALPPQARTMISQFGPLLEQLSVRAINAPLADLNGQEFTALMLQVLPQALPPQHVQAALAPQAVHGYQALAKFLIRTGAASHGEEILAAIKAIRKHLTAQIRQSGILGGPDYSDPDEVAKK